MDLDFGTPVRDEVWILDHDAMDDWLEGTPTENEPPKKRRKVATSPTHDDGDFSMPVPPKVSRMPLMESMPRDLDVLQMQPSVLSTGEEASCEPQPTASPEKVCEPVQVPQQIEVVQPRRVRGPRRRIQRRNPVWFLELDGACFSKNCMNYVASKERNNHLKHLQGVASYLDAPLFRPLVDVMKWAKEFRHLVQRTAVFFNLRTEEDFIEFLTPFCKEEDPEYHWLEDPQQQALNFCLER